MNFLIRSIGLFILCVLAIFLVFVKPAACKGLEAEQLEDMRNFIDDFFFNALDKGDIPGAAIVAVYDGELFFSGGYGYADLENLVKIAPSETVFFVESVSKSFTATAMLHLVDKGAIDLESDVNNYLSSFQLPDIYAQPVTIADLLVHTGGFDDTDLGAYAKSEEEVIPLKQYLLTNMPGRVMPPGEVVSYSNHGYALAGLVIEEVSGISYIDYMDQEILSPLMMDSSSFVLSGQMESRLAKPYIFHNGQFQSVTFLYHNYTPAGALKATAEDMANFIVMHLQDGKFKDEQILSAGMLSKMHEQQFTNHKSLPGWTYGFYEKSLNGHRIIMHGGANRLGHSSKLFLFPEKQLGFFLASNTFNPELRENFIVEFMDQFFPADNDFDLPVMLPVNTEADGGITGNYSSTRQSRNSIEKITLLMGQLTVQVENDYLQLTYPQNFKSPERWSKVEPGLFQSVNDQSLMAFRENEKGEITYMFIGQEAYERLPWHTNPQLNLVFLLTMIIGHLSIIIRWPIIYGKQKKNIKSVTVLKKSFFTSWALAVLNILFLACVLIVFLNYQVELAYGIPLLIRILFVVPFAALILTVLSIIFCFLVWSGKNLSLSFRLHYTVFTICALGFIIFLYYWNLIGFY